MSVEQFENEVVELAVRRVRTPEGAQFYGLPIGAPITQDVIDAKQAAAAAQGLKPPTGALSSGKNGGGSHMAGTISGQAAAQKNAPKPASPEKLKIKIKKSTLNGNKHFSVGKSKYTAPNGSKLIRPTSQPGMAYVVTPDGEVHAFNEAGEIEIPKTLKSVFGNKFGPNFEGDENYNVEEFEVTSASSSLDSLKVGATLTDQRGTPQFKKLADDSWEHIDLGVKLKDADLQPLYDDGELVPDTTDEDVSTAEETFANTEAMNFGEMGVSETVDALNNMQPGQKVSLKTEGKTRVFTKQEDGSWQADGTQENGEPFKPADSDTLAYVKDFLSVGADPEPEYNPLDVTTVNPLDGEKPLIGVGDTPDEDWISNSQPGAQLTFTSPSGNKTIWNKQEDGSWLNQKNGKMSEQGMLDNFKVGGSSLKITKEGKEPKPGREAPSAERAPSTPAEPNPTVMRSTSNLKPGEGDYTDLATTEQMEVATIGDRVLVEFAGGEMVSEYELDQDEKWTNVDDPEDFFGKKTMNAMVADQASEQVYIHSTKQSKPLKPEEPETGGVNSTDLLWSEDMEPLDIISTDSPDYLFPGDYDYTDETTEEDILNAEPGDKILIGYDPDWAEGDGRGIPHYEAWDLVEKQPDGSWKGLAGGQSEYDTDELESWTSSTPGDSESMAQQLFTFKGNSTKQPKAETPDEPSQMSDQDFSKKLIDAPPGSKLIGQDGQVPYRKNEDGSWSKGASKKAVSHYEMIQAGAKDWDLVTPFGSEEQSSPATPDEGAPTHALLGDEGVNKIGGQAGSNEGGLYEIPMSDGSTQKYYVKKAQDADHGNNESLANALYRELGVNAPEFDHAADGNLYSKIVDGKQDMQARLEDPEWLDKVRRDFAIDAWLSNRDVFGLTYDNILTDPDGNPWRIDNGGALRYRAMGEKKTDFGPEVTELDVFRTGKKAKVFGSDMTQEQELDGAKRLQALTPERIQEMVSEYGMDQDMADTLVARRKYILDKYGLQDTPDADVTDGQSSLTEKQAALVPSNGVEIDPANHPEIQEGDEVHEITPGGNLIVSVKQSDGNYVTTLPDGLEMDSYEDEVFASTSTQNNKFFLVSKQTEQSLPAEESTEGDWQWDVGHTITSVADLESIQPGTKLEYTKKDGSKSYYTKLDNGAFLTPGGSVYDPSQLSGSAKSKKFTVYSIPETNTPSAPVTNDQGYVDGDGIQKMGHVNDFEVGQKLEVVLPATGEHAATVEKTDKGWVALDDGYFIEGQNVSPSDMGTLVTNNALKYMAPEAQQTPSTDLDTQLWSGAPAMSEAQITDAYKALEAHTSFHVSYGLKSLPDGHPLKDADTQDSLKTAALNKYPDMKAKPAVVQYLKDAIGVNENDGQADIDAPKVRIGSKDPKSTGVQGVDGGEFTTIEIQQAIDILEAYDGKLFKAELNKKGSPLGSLNPNSIVGFDKDKTVVKQKFIDLLKAKLVRTEENIKHPKVKDTEEFDGLQIGTQVSYTPKDGSAKQTYTKVNENQWVWDDDKGVIIDANTFHTYVNEGGVRIEKQPDPLPEYAKTPNAVKDKEVSEIDVENFGPDDLDTAEEGTTLEGVDDPNPIYLVKDSAHGADKPWTIIYSDGTHGLGFTNNEVKAVWEPWKLGLKQKDGPNFNQNNDDGIVPGKYSTKTGKAYMVVHADGTGVYVNSQGNVSKLTKAAVKKNFSAGMTEYHGMPESVPSPDTSSAPAAKKPKVVGDIPDGIYFAGSPSNAKTAVYEVNGDKATVFKPNTSLAGLTGTKIGSQPNQAWLAQTGTGASFNGYIYDDGKYVGTGTWTKGSDGLWRAKKGGEEVGQPTAEPTIGWSSKITSHGLADPVEFQKAKVNTLFSQGKLVDQYGMSVVPEGYTGSVYYLGATTTVPALVSARKYLDGVETTNAATLSEDLKKLGVYWDNDLWKKWRLDNGFTDGGAENVIAALKKSMDDQLVGVDTDIPESNASDLFEWNDMGQAKIPVSVAAMTYSSYDKTSMGNYIKAASAAIGGGKIIGQHWGKMDKYDRQAWISAFKKGDFKKMYELEVAAAAQEGKAHNAGYLHPGYSGNEATNQIIWAPAVEGEISALDDVDGDWTTPGITPSMAEVDNYLIKAQMQNPTFLTAAEKRQWYTQHRGKNKDAVDQLSALALQRKLDGQQALSDAPTWTDDVKPAKNYDTVFENAPTPFPTGDMWKATSYSVTTAWAKDNLDDEDFKAFYSKDYPDWDLNDGNYQTQYQTETIVADYFDKKHNEYQEELLKPVYSLTKQVSLGSHEVWFAKDQFDRQYIFKPADSKDYQVRLQMEGKANELAKFWGFNAAKAHMGEIDGKTGLIQEFVPSVSSFAGEDGEGIHMPSLNDKQLASVAAEHVLDWMLDNDDTHPDNLLLKQDGSIVGIDKGRAFYVYGNWDGITGDASAHTNAPDASNSDDFLVYTRLYNDIRDGKITKEQATAAYFGARKAALRIQNSSDSAVEQMVREAVQGRENWDVPDYMAHFTNRKAPSDPDSLVKAVLYRKNHLAEQIDGMWSKIFQDSGLGDLPEAPPKVFDNHISGWEEPDVIEAATEAKVWGAAPLHSSAAIVNGHSLIWTEQDENGTELHKGKFTVGELTQQQLLSFLAPKAQQVQIGAQGNQNIYLNSGVEFPNTGTWKSFISAAAKNITKNSATKEYDKETLSMFEQTASTIGNDLQHWAPDLQPVGGYDYVEFPSGNRVAPEYLPQYKLMLQHYQTQIDKVRAAKDSGGTTEKSDFVVFQALAPKKDPRILTSPEGATYTELANGQWLKSDGELVDVGALPVDANDLPEGWTANVEPTPVVEQVQYTTQTAAGKSGTLNEGGIKVENSKDEGTSGHSGKEYRITLPTGEVITFRNSSSTNTLRSQRGTMTFKLAGDDKQASLARVQAQLELMGLNMNGAENDTAELNYWRAMFGRVIGSDAESSGSAGVKSALKKLKDKKKTVKGPNGETLSDQTLIEGLGLNMDPNDELQMWRELANEAWGKEKVDAWIAGEKYLPKFQHMDLSDPTKNTGMPYYDRIDVDVDALLKKGHMLAIGNSGKDDSLLKYITSGGMISTEERLRILGYYKTGASSSSDQGTGGANSVFTRIAHTGSGVEFSGAIYGQHVAYWNPAVLSQVGTYSYSGDQFGNLDYLQGSNKLDPLKALSGYTGSGNETMVSNALSIFDWLEIMVFNDAAKRNEAIQRMKALGFETLRGLPIEERLIMRVNLKDAIEKVKKQWAK